MREKRYEKRNKSNKIRMNGGRNYRFSEKTEAKDPFIHKVLRLCNTMEEAFEADTNDDHVGEWMVEFVAKVNGKKHTTYRFSMEPIEKMYNKPCFTNFGASTQILNASM